jgi:hypothetical protein
MTWWAVAFTLSVLARYKPAEWGRHIDVDSSPYAVAIEGVLSRALDELPGLVAQTIDEVARAVPRQPRDRASTTGALLPERSNTDLVTNDATPEDRGVKSS